MISASVMKGLSNYGQNATFILMLYFYVLEYQIRALNTLLLNYHLPKLHISAFIIAFFSFYKTITRLTNLQQTITK